ncbi:MAG: ATPase [Acidobacteria bacterium]|nr:ATPase [Acidobacteriota bacterium]
MNKKLLSIYGLKWHPFASDLPDEALWRTPAMEHFCWRLEQQIRDGGFALVTGDPGTGKSVALRITARQLTAVPDVLVGALSRPQSKLADIYRELGDLFSVPLSPHNRWGGFKALREKWLAHLSATLYRPVLLIDEAQQMESEVFSELRLLASTHFDSRSLLTVILAGDSRLLERLRSPDLIPLGSRIRTRLVLDYLTPRELASFVEHLLTQSGNPRLMTPELVTTLCERAAGNYRVLCNMAADLLAEGIRREAAQLDEKLYLEVFAPPSKQRNRSDGRRAAG